MTQTITDTTEFETVTGRSYVIALSGHAGETTSLQYQDNLGNWIDVADTTATDDFGGVYDAPSSLSRVLMSAPGSLSFTAHNLIQKCQ